MKRILFMGVAIVVLSATAVFAEKVEVTSQIKSVTVFGDRALVARQAELELKPGTYELLCGDLPLNINDNSVRAEGQGTAKAVITGLRIEKLFLTEAGVERIKDLEEKIEALKDEIRGIKNQKQILKTEREFLESLQVHASEALSDEMTREMPEPEEFGDFIKFMHQQLSANYQELHKLIVTQREKVKELNVLEKELGQIQNWRPDERKKVIVGVDVKDEGTLKLVLSYVVYGAGWGPAYSARAFLDDKKVELTYLGMVRQKTGEEWSDVKLALSTARPAIYAKMPEVQPWYLKKWEPRPEYKKERIADFIAMKAERSPMAAAPMELREEEMSVAVAEVEQRGTAVSYNIAKAESIPSDGDKYKTTISINTFPAKMFYLATPELSPYVYLKAEVKNDTDLHYLPGGVDIFMAQDFVGHSELEAIAPTEKFDLFLGVDEGLKIEKELVKEREEETGVFGKSKVLSYTYKITAENYKDKPQSLTIKDRVPVSQYEDIVVKLGTFSVPPVKDQEKQKEFKEKGLVEWQLTLQPQEKKEIIYDFTVSYPLDMKVEGI